MSKVGFLTRCVLCVVILDVAVPGSSGQPNQKSSSASDLDPAAPIQLAFKHKRAECSGTVETVPNTRYRNKKSFRKLYVKLERGKTYQFYLHSKVFQGFIYLEDGLGNVLAEKRSPKIGGEVRLNYKALKTGVYRIIATSVGGFRTGAFVSTVRAVNPLLVDLPKEYEWFDDIDFDGDGQVALYEWRKAKKELREYPRYDFNNDAFITPLELIRFVNAQPKKKQ